MNAPLNLVYCPRQTPTCLVSSGVLDSIGHTPLIQLKRASETTGCHIVAKAEFMNPGGSIKDRVAKHALLAAEKRGDLVPGSTIMEVTTGNTGIALAMVGAMCRYHVVIIMPQTVSLGRRRTIEYYGAEVELLDAAGDVRHALSRIEHMAANRDDVFLPRQFANPDNIDAHRLTTGPEILRQVKGEVDAFVMGVGTGGTVMGVGRTLRKAGSHARIVAVEPDEPAALSGDPRDCHGIEGLADGIVPDLVCPDEIDEVIRIKTRDAVAAAHEVGRDEGLLVGTSSGANILAAEQVARELGPGHTVVTVLCDRGERYLSINGTSKTSA